MRYLGPSVAKGPFGAGKIVNSIWPNTRLSTLSSSEMLHGLLGEERVPDTHLTHPEELSFYVYYRWTVSLKEGSATKRMQHI